MHVLVTADSLSGSWTYARELVTGLVTRGIRVTLVSFGEIPLPIKHPGWITCTALTTDRPHSGWNGCRKLSKTCPIRRIF